AGSFVSIGAGPEPPCGAAAGAAEEAGLRAALPPRGVGTPEAALRRGGRERLAVAVIGPPDEADDARTGASLLVVRLGLHSRAGARRSLPALATRRRWERRTSLARHASPRVRSKRRAGRSRCGRAKSTGSAPRGWRGDGTPARPHVHLARGSSALSRGAHHNACRAP